MKRIFTALLLFIAICNTGCVTTYTLADAQNSKGLGSSKIYDRSYEVVWNAVIETLKTTDLSLVSENKETGKILAQRGMTLVSHGENVAIYVEKLENITKTRVEIVNKRAVAMNVFAADWESEILQALNLRLAVDSDVNSPPSNRSITQQIRELNILRKEGLITEEEFKKKKSYFLEKFQ